jgi:hypothetical protein
VPSCLTARPRSLRRTWRFDRVVPLFDVHEIKLLQVLTDRATELRQSLSGMHMNSTWPWRTSTIAVPKPEVHLTFGIVERFHKTLAF